MGKGMRKTIVGIVSRYFTGPSLLLTFLGLSAEELEEESYMKTCSNALLPTLLREKTEKCEFKSLTHGHVPFEEKIHQWDFVQRNLGKCGSLLAGQQET